MASTTAAAIITDWSIQAINPDGTANTFLPSISGGSVPPDFSTELIDWLAMGGEFELSINCELSGTHPNGQNCNLNGTLVRYNPAMYMEYLGVYYPPGSFPQGGYTAQIPATAPSPSASYAMVLVGQRENLPSNKNGSVTLTITGIDSFTITHRAFLVSDTEQYPTGNYLQNWQRLSRNSVYADADGTIDRPSVFGTLRGLNVNIAIRQYVYVVIAPDLSIPIKASFAGFDPSGNPEAITAEFIIERVSDPGVEQESLSPFEANLVKVRFTDPSALIVQDESEVTFTLRDLDYNVSTFEDDLQIKKAKLITAGGSSQLDGPIYNPVTWSQSAGVTEISFVLDNLEKASLYQIHVRAAIQDTPSTTRFAHYMTEVVSANGAPYAIPFTAESKFWTRNGENGEAFTCAPYERVTSVFSMNASEYDAAVVDPWVSFDQDIDRVTIQILNADGTINFETVIIKNSDNTWTDTDYIGVYESSGPSIDTVYYFYLKEFRIPGLNYQELQNWIGETKTFRWKALFIDIRNSEFSGEYFQDTELTVADFENDSPSPYVKNIKFLNPTTLDVISDWSGLDTVRVVADIEPVGPNTYIQVLVDRFPLGVDLFNDYALEEDDPSSHSLPAYVIFEQKTSDLISELPAQPFENAISFLLDVSELSDDERMNVYIQAYEA